MRKKVTTTELDFHSTRFQYITWIMEGDQGKVIQRSLRSAQGCFQNLGGALDYLDQVVVHGAGHIKNERQGGCALRDVLLCGLGPRVLPGGKRH